MTAARVRTAVLLLLALAGLTALSACGNRKETITRAETEGPYLDVGELQYQVQVSRQLNPEDVEDREYLVGLAPEEAQLEPDETWFAIFIRVQNETDEPQPASKQFEIEDTLGTVYEPIPIRSTNPFAYRTGMVEPGATLPPQNSPAHDGPIGGSLVLFKMPLASLANRPLELKIKSPLAPQTEGVVDLDV